MSNMSYIFTELLGIGQKIFFLLNFYFRSMLERYAWTNIVKGNSKSLFSLLILRKEFCILV